LVAAPRPIGRVEDEASADGIEVYVVELFLEFGLGVDVEVVVAGLPNFGFGVGAGEGLFEDLDGCGEGFEFWFGEEEVDVVGHDHVSEDVEFVTVAGLIEDLEEGVSGLWGSEDGAVAEAGDSEEVVVAFVVDTD
jgi:hypothetical protein